MSEFNGAEKFIPHHFLKLLHKEHLNELHLGDNITLNVTVLFTDIRGYAKILKEQTPKQAFAFINNYLRIMSPLIRQYNGFINQYHGDAIQALFPLVPEDAIKATAAMNAALGVYNESRNKKEAPLRVGYGLNTGHAMIGMIGDEERMDVNVISDAVKMGTQIEGLNKLYGTKCLISEFTYHGLNDKGAFICRRLDKISVKDKGPAFYIYEVHLDEATKKEQEFIQCYEAAFRTYETGDFSRAMVLFTACEIAKPADKATRLLIERCARLMEMGVSDSWDGAFIRLAK